MATSADIHERLQASYQPYHNASTDTDRLSLALVKALCNEHFPTGVRVVCDITDQGGDTLVFSWVEDAAGEQLDMPDVPNLEDMLWEALGNLNYEQVENDGTRRMPRPVINLDGEFPIPPAPPVLYEKCAGCHLFVEPNDVPAEPGIAPHVHLSRGDDADEAIENNHEAKPSGLLATLDVWKAFGPPAMRVRFTDLPQRFAAFVLEGDMVGGFLLPDDQSADGIEQYVLDHLDVTVLQDTIPHTLDAEES